MGGITVLGNCSHFFLHVNWIATLQLCITKGSTLLYSHVFVCKPNHPNTSILTYHRLGWEKNKEWKREWEDFTLITINTLTVASTPCGFVGIWLNWLR